MCEHINPVNTYSTSYHLYRHNPRKAKAKRWNSGCTAPHMDYCKRVLPSDQWRYRVSLVPACPSTPQCLGMLLWPHPLSFLLLWEIHLGAKSVEFPWDHWALSHEVDSKLLVTIEVLMICTRCKERPQPEGSSVDLSSEKPLWFLELILMSLFVLVFEEIAHNSGLESTRPIHKETGKTLLVYAVQPEVLLFTDTQRQSNSNVGLQQ